MRRVVAVLVAASLTFSWLAAAAPRGAETATARVEFPAKPSGPIAVDFSRAAALEVGVPHEVTITARVAGSGAGLTIDVDATLPQAVLLTAPTVVEAGEGAQAWRLTVVALAADAGYLNVIVAGTIDGVAQASSVTIPLRSPANGRAIETADDNEPLIALPVEETP